MTDRPKQRDLKLELTWVGKDHRPRLEPRILLPDEERSYTAAARVSENDQFDNMLIFGDNLLALKALATDNRVKGQVKCIFIDPPYNTGSAFEHYDDGLEHSLWLSMIRERLELFRDLLSVDGTIWISIDDNEMPYLKVMCDEIFGRINFVSTIIWEKADSPRNSARQFSVDHDYILVFSSNPDWQPNKLPRTEEANSIYANPDNDPRGDWIAGDPFANKPYSKGLYTIVGPTGREFKPPAGRYWRISEEKLRELDKDNRIWWGPKGDARPSIKRYLSEVADLVPRTLWKKEDVGSNRTAKNETRLLFPADPFATPKPEKLLERIIHLATQPGDLVLDSFAGSGTTGAVAHKMGRRWIMVELGEHAHTHIIPRMQKVIDGTDQGGISEAVEWKGGGGFRYYRLAPSLIKYDSRQHPIINPEYNAEMLAEACCKLEGFTYDPSQAVWWQHGRSSERDFLFVTTRYMGYSDLLDLSEEVGPERSLLVLAKAYDREGDVFDNLTIKKIPDAVLGLCEWDHDDYSLKVANLPQAKPEPQPASVTAGPRTGRKGRVKAGPGLFDMDGEA